MIHPFRSARRPAGVIQGYIAAELVGDALGGIVVSGGGMPADTVYMETTATIVGVTCVAAPMFRGKAHKLATSRSLDVALVRCCLHSSDILPLSVDVTLARGGLAAITMNDMALYRHGNGDLWLVPVGFGGALRIGGDGIELHLVPPYETLLDRMQGIFRATIEQSVLLHPREVEGR